MIRLEGVTKTYAGFGLDVDLRFENEITAVIGPSGSGKSTLLGILSGHDTPDSGTVTLNGRQLDGVVPEERNIGMIFQRPTLFPHLSVRANIEYGAEIDDSEIHELCELLEIANLLETDRSPETLSGGEKRRVSVARAIVTAPDALLLDEPTTGLDEPIRRRLKYELRRVLTELDIPCIYVTHDQNEASVVADSVVVMRDGAVLQQGDYGEILESPRNEFVADFVGIENLIRGEIRQTGSGRTVVDIGGALVEPESPGVEGAGAPNTEVCVGIAPESMTVTANPRDDEERRTRGQDPGATGARTNRIECVVEQVIPERGAKTVFLECGLPKRLKAVSNADSTIEAGNEVVVEFDASDVVIV